MQLDKYQEQGQLLEPYLETIVSPLMNIIRSRTIELGTASDEILEIIKPICIIVYSLVTVCGYKSVIKFFPHQVSDLELAVSLLEKCHHTNSVTSLRQESTGEMEAKCVTLLWLYILVLVPFDISTVDTSIANDESLAEFELSPLVLRILGFCKDYLSTAGPMRTMAGLVLSRLLTRPDMPKAFTRFISVCFVDCLVLVKFSLRLPNIFVLSRVVVLFVWRWFSCQSKFISSHHLTPCFVDCVYKYNEWFCLISWKCIDLSLVSSRHYLLSLQISFGLCACSHLCCI